MPNNPMTETLINLGFNGGAFGVLLVIAMYLMRNIPKWIDSHLATIKDISVVHKEETLAAQAMYTREAEKQREQCHTENERMVSLVEKSNSATLKAFEAVGQRIADHHNWGVQAMSDMSRRIEKP